MEDDFIGTDRILLKATEAFCQKIICFECIEITSNVIEIFNQTVKLEELV